MHNKEHMCKTRVQSVEFEVFTAIKIQIAVF